MNDLVNNSVEQWLPIIEAVIFASQQPVSLGQLELILQEDGHVIERVVIKEVLALLQGACESRSIALMELASGYQYRVKPEFAPWLAKLTEERPQRYSRALLETLALIVYRQPVTRAEIEEVRGVAVSSHILRTLIEREWVKVVGHKDVPGKPALLATTRAFLDYFNLKSLRDLPPLEAFINLENAGEQLELLLSETALPDHSEFLIESSEEERVCHEEE
ncbi:MAG: SMC-Scp complex subunit ScpB [Gammaproteobacteria bacterium]|nr:SMC-Scp complex subunit ScpB [Gammaproteobacteria bacterium]